MLLSGANGIGKTTLLKSLLGIIPPIAGEVERGDYLELGYFEQEVEGGNRQTPLEAVWNAFPALNQAEVRAALARCGLTTKHIESQIQVLSGGEQAKVRFCLLMNRENNVLVLDEPTTIWMWMPRMNSNVLLKNTRDLFLWSVTNQTSMKAGWTKSGTSMS